MKNMDKDPKTSTRMLAYQTKFLPKLQMYVSGLKLTQSDLLNHITTPTLRKIPTMQITLSMHTNNTSEKMMMKDKYLMISMIKKPEEELSHIHPDIEHYFTSPTMNSGLVSVQKLPSHLH